jgi:hypothetical protein
MEIGQVAYRMFLEILNITPSFRRDGPNRDLVKGILLAVYADYSQALDPRILRGGSSRLLK